MRLDHVQLAAPPGCEAEARAFYGGLLGLEEIEKPPPGLGVAEAELDGFARRLQHAGARVEWDDRHPGIRRFFTADPFGNRVELLAAGAAPGEDAERPQR